MPIFRFEGVQPVQMSCHAENLADAIKHFRSKFKGLSWGMEVTYKDGAILHEHTVHGYCEACDQPLLDDDYFIGEDACFCRPCAKSLAKAG